jgi:hypothetical protein
MITPKRLVPGSALTGSLATYYTVGTATTALVKQITFCNTHTAAITCDMHIIPPAGTGGVANQIFQDLALQAGETKMFSVSEVLPTGYFIQALASTTDKVAFTVSGVEVT